MIAEKQVLIAAYIDLLFEGLTSYVLKLAPRAQIVQVRALDELVDHAGRATDYALIILDRDLPGLSGLPLAGDLLRSLGRFPLVVLTTSFHEEELAQTLQSGVNTYLPLSVPGPMIVAGLGLALCGQTYFPQDGALLRPAPHADTGYGLRPYASPAASPVNITRRQREVLRLLAAGKTNAEIAKALGLAEPTIRLHLREAYRRLGVRNRAQAMRTALQLFPQVSRIG